MQERIMTTDYTAGRFRWAAFCVLANRLLAVVVSGILAKRKTGTLETPAPFRAFSYCSLSNVMSSYGQYAALLYASFPLQVLFKSSKIIPVMAMGKVLNGKNYKLIEYAEAFIITSGVAVFSLFDGKKHPSASPLSTGSEDGSQEASQGGSYAPIAGFLFLTLYVCCDSFTSQWQSRLYTSYPDKKSLTQYHMMFYVNCWSILFSGTWLISTGDGYHAIVFLSKSTEAIPHIVTSAVVACIGQLFIFYTIKRWGPIVFTVIMTTRQMLSMILSCIIFGHSVTGGMGIGAAVVFAAVFHGLWRKWTAKKSPSGEKTPASDTQEKKAVSEPTAAPTEAPRPEA